MKHRPSTLISFAGTTIGELFQLMPEDFYQRVIEAPLREIPFYLHNSAQWQMSDFFGIGFAVIMVESLANRRTHVTDAKRIKQRLDLVPIAAGFYITKEVLEIALGINGSPPDIVAFVAGAAFYTMLCQAEKNMSDYNR